MGLFGNHIRNMVQYVVYGGNSQDLVEYSCDIVRYLRVVWHKAPDSRQHNILEPVIHAGDVEIAERGGLTHNGFISQGEVVREMTSHF